MNASLTQPAVLPDFDSSRFQNQAHKDVRVALVQPLIPDGNYLPNLGIMYIASTCLREGLDVRVFDENIHGNILELLKEFKPHVLGITCVTAAVPASARIAEQVKEAHPQCRVVIGGPHISSVPKETLERYPVLDFGFFGESEALFPNFCLDVAGGKTDFSHVPNLVWRKNEGHGMKIVKNIAERFLDDHELDALPFPAWHLLPIEQVFSRATHGLFSKGKRIMPVMTTRGCPNYCGFCARIMGFKFRKRDISLVLKEIQWLYDTYKIDELYFEDDTFTQDMNRAMELLDGVISLKLPIYVKFANGLRADRVSRELLQKMKDAGVYWVGFGIESGSPHTQKLMLKNLDLPQARENVLLAKRMGFKIGSNCIIGYPGETKQSIRESIRYFLSLKLDSFAVVTCVPFPGTTVWKECESHGWFTDRARDYANYWFEIFKVTPLVETPYLTSKDLSRAIFWTYIRFYFLNFNRFRNLAKALIRQKIGKIFSSIRLLRANTVAQKIALKESIP